MNNRLFTLAILLALTLTAGAFAQDRVKIAKGTLEGTSDKSSGVRSFKGIPFGEPPIGDLRWKPPQPVKDWQGVRKADKFGPRCMQRPLFGDMRFRSNGMSEDCLYLNVWTPAKSGNEKLPVLVYFFGGGFVVLWRATARRGATTARVWRRRASWRSQSIIAWACSASSRIPN